MSVNIATEVRRISDARTRLKAIIDMQAQAQAALLSPDDFTYQTNATITQSDLGYSDDITVDSQNSKSVSGLQMPLAPSEPDLSTLMVWMPFGNLGKQDDLALMGNSGRTRGSCSVVAGPPGCGNNVIGLVRAVNFDGSTSYLDVPNANNIHITSSGFSFCVRIKVTSYDLQTENPNRMRTVACKTDDASNAWELVISSTNGNLLFHVKYAGLEYKIAYSGMTLGTWYDVVCTFAALPAITTTIYVNNVLSRTADTTASQYPSAANGDTDLHIGHASNIVVGGNEYGLGGSFDPISFDSVSFDTSDYLDPANKIPHNTIEGAFNGAMQDPRLYNFPLSAAQVSNLYTNKLTISNIDSGAVAAAGYCICNTGTSMYTSVAHAITIKYNIGGRVLRSLTIIYKITHEITRAMTVKYRVRKQVTRARTLKYNITANLTRVVNHRQIIYKIGAPALIVAYGGTGDATAGTGDRALGKAAIIAAYSPILQATDNITVDTLPGTQNSVDTGKSMANHPALCRVYISSTTMASNIVSDMNDGCTYFDYDMESDLPSYDAADPVAAVQSVANTVHGHGAKLIIDVAQTYATVDWITQFAPYVRAGDIFKIQAGGQQSTNNNFYNYVSPLINAARSHVAGGVKVVVQVSVMGQNQNQNSTRAIACANLIIDTIDGLECFMDMNVQASIDDMVVVYQWWQAHKT